MKLIRNKNYLFFVFYGIISILLGVVEWHGATATGENPVSSQIIVGTLFLAMGLYLSRKPESEVLIDERIKKRDMKVSSPPGYHVDILQIDVNNWCCHYFSGCAQDLLQQER